MKQFVTAIAVLLSLLAAPTQAATRPESLRLDAYIYPEEGQRLLVYTVSCSDRSQPQIIKTEGERRWCADNTCFRDKMDAAIKACTRDSGGRVVDRK